MHVTRALASTLFLSDLVYQCGFPIPALHSKTQVN
jgi:hypothetical protein